MNSIKKQKDMTPKSEPPMLEDVQYATIEEWTAITKSLRKNEADGPKWKWQFWMYLVMKVKSNAVKKNIA